MKKRLLSAILSLCMLLTMAPTVAFAAEDDEAAPQNNSVLKGSCGAEGNEGSVQWALTDDDGDGSYTLTISGSGAMADYYAQYVQRKDEFTGDIAPWRRALLSDTNAERTTEEVVPITEVVIGDGVTRIGSGAFAYTKLTGTVTFNANVTSYGDGVLQEIPQLQLSIGQTSSPRRRSQTDGLRPTRKSTLQYRMHFLMDAAA